MKLESGSSPERGLLRVGDFLADPACNEIRRMRGSTRITVEPRVLDVLSVLAANAGETVERKTLLEQCWPGTHVSDDALNRCIWKLRRAFEQLGVKQNVVATVPKRGYRLLLPVGDPEAGRSASTTATPVGTAGRSLSQVLLLSLCLAVAGSAALLWLTHSSSSFSDSGDREKPDGSAFLYQPITHSVGYESAPSFSPDGSRVAFEHYAKQGPWQGQMDLYIQDLADGTNRRVAGTPDPEISPSWSPSGERLAFIRVEAGRGRLMLIDLGSGQEAFVDDCGPAFQPPDYWVPAVIWERSGRFLLHTKRPEPGLPSRVFRYDLETADSVLLTLPPNSTRGDRQLALSPDGRRLAVVRTRLAGVEDVFLVDLDTLLERQLTFDGRSVSGLDWKSNSELVFSSLRGGTFQLWSILVPGGRIRPLDTVGLNATAPRFSTRGDLIYEEWRSQIDLRSLVLDGNGLTGSNQLAVTSSRWDWRPEYSPDGTTIAFLSNRTGSTEIWLTEERGEPRRLTRLEGNFASTPRWSPDGRWLLLAVPRGGNSDLYRVSAQDGATVRLTQDASDEIEPLWSQQAGRYAFASNRSGTWQIWEGSVSGASPRPITRNGGWGPVLLTADQLLFLKPQQAGLWRLNLQTGEESLLDADYDALSFRNSAVVGDGLYFVRTRPDHPAELFHFSFTSGLGRPLGPVEGDSLAAEFFSEGGIAVSPDQRRLLVASIEKSDSDLWVRSVKGIR